MNNARARYNAKTTAECYMATIESIEPSITSIDVGAFYASVAISQKRIADTMRRLECLTYGIFCSAVLFVIGFFVQSLS